MKILSAQSHKPLAAERKSKPKAHRIPVGVVPNASGPLSAGATLRF